MIAFVVGIALGLISGGLMSLLSKGENGRS